MGKVFFVILQDVGGCIQLYVVCDDFLEGVYNEQFKKWDFGDIFGVKGKLFKIKIGELFIYCIELCLLIKVLCLLLDKFYGLQDQEVCYCQCYFDFIFNDEFCNIFKVCLQIFFGICQFMVNCGFMEVEMLMMQVISGGVVVCLFIIYYNVLDFDMYLCIVLELYFKCLVVGGFECVFEINCNFCNEGIFVCYNLEFIMMEFYMVYVDYKDLIELIELLFCILVQDIFGKMEVIYGDVMLDFGKLFEKLIMCEVIKKYCLEIDMVDLDNFDFVKVIVEFIGIYVEKSWGLGCIVIEIFEEVVEVYLIQLIFIIEYLVEVFLLVCCNDVNLEIIDCFEFFIGGCEIGNGFSELNDVEDQVECFQEQVNVKVVGDDEVMFYDEDYVIVLEYGLLLIVGLGIGID